MGLLDEIGVEKLSARPLEFTWVLDVSSSMVGKRIEALNFAIKETIPAMKEIAKENPQADIFVRCLTFSDTAKWHKNKTKLSDFNWEDVSANGMTNFGDALAKLSEVFRTENMPQRGLPPVVVLVSDGDPNDVDWEQRLQEFLGLPWGVRAVKIAIAVTGANKKILKSFMGDTSMEVLEASNAADLVNYLKWASTEVLKAASNTASIVNKDSVVTSNIHANNHVVLQGIVSPVKNVLDTDLF